VCFGGSPCADILPRDRDADEDGVYDEPGAVTLTRISVGPGGVQGVDHSRLQKTKVAGAFKVSVKAKRWFTAAAANEPASSSTLTVTIGTQCFSVPVTLNKD
jgi:hypothetical protein